MNNNLGCVCSLSFATYIDRSSAMMVPFCILSAEKREYVNCMRPFLYRDELLSHKVAGKKKFGWLGHVLFF